MGLATPDPYGTLLSRTGSQALRARLRLVCPYGTGLQRRNGIWGQIGYHESRRSEVENRLKLDLSPSGWPPFAFLAALGAFLFFCFHETSIGWRTSTTGRGREHARKVGTGQMFRGGRNQGQAKS
jgi:hypothetical protein